MFRGDGEGFDCGFEFAPTAFVEAVG